MRTAFFVDGYNLYYGLIAGTTYKWLDLPKLLHNISHIQNPTTEIVYVGYFTSPVQPGLATRGIDSKHAQDTYIRALKAKHVEVFLGKHRIEHSRAPRWYSDKIPVSRQDLVDIWELKEKETDVHIAISMYQLAAKQALAAQPIKQLVLVSADTDMIPVLRAIRIDFPELIIGIILPHRPGSPRTTPGSLNEYCHWIRKHIRTDELAQCQLPLRVQTGKKTADKPDYW